MIQPTELRLGNLVASNHFKDKEVVMTVIELRATQAIVRSPNGTTSPMLYDNEMRGIPITMDWLLRLGFKPNPDMPWLMENGALMCNTGNHWIWHWSGSVIKDIKCVHELQNVMFALSGRELEVRS